MAVRTLVGITVALPGGHGSRAVPDGVPGLLCGPADEMRGGVQDP
jgi:hypothetical protein